MDSGEEKGKKKMEGIIKIIKIIKKDICHIREIRNEQGGFLNPG